MQKLDILNLLNRSDKWYLGGGNRLIWAPPFPEFLDYPGFWDRAQYYNFEFGPLFTWTILNAEGQEIPLKFISREWNPACLLQIYQRGHVNQRGNDLSIIERKAIVPENIAVSFVQLRNQAKHRLKLHFIVWTIQESWPSQKKSWLTDIAFNEGKITFTTHLKPPLQFRAIIGINQKVASYSINLSEGTTLLPRWSLTPFYESFSGNRLPDEIKLRGVNEDGLIFMALHTEILLQPNSEKSLVIGFATAPIAGQIDKFVKTLTKVENPIKSSEKSWNDYFDQVPRFKCSDDYFMRYYWYRWYGLHLNTIKVNEGNYTSPFVCEGIGNFRAP
ncbi:MAG: hypothetical protein ACE5HX_19490, partial [bacterium]